MQGSALARRVTTAVLTILILLLAACSDSSPPSGTTAQLEPFPPLPGGKSSPVEVSGEVTDWLFEGDAGCFGTLSDGTTKIEVYSEADVCEHESVDTGSVISVVLVFDAAIQQDIGDGMNPSYTIVEFK